LPACRAFSLWAVRAHALSISERASISTRAVEKLVGKAPHRQKTDGEIEVSSTLPTILCNPAKWLVMNGLKKGCGRVQEPLSQRACQGEGLFHR
jgi:hypothetical protein